MDWFITIANCKAVGAVSCSNLFFFLVNNICNFVKIEARTRQFLHDLGLCKYARQAVDHIKDGVSAVDKYAQDNYPEYYKKTVEFSQPYLQLTRDMGLVAYNVFVNVQEYAVEKYPVVLETVHLEKHC